MTKADETLDALEALTGVRPPDLFQHVEHVKPGPVVADFVIQDGRPRLWRVQFAPLEAHIDPPDETTYKVTEPAPGPDELAEYPWAELFHSALMGQLVQQHLAKGAPADEDRWVAETHQISHTAEVVSGKRKRTNNRWTPDFARTVARTYKVEGIEGVARVTNVVLRQARRYVTRAQEEGYLS